MKEKSLQQRSWNKMGIIFLALVGGFLLSFLGFGLLWSGISWFLQLLMFFPFLLLAWAISRWNKGLIDGCAGIFLGAAPLGILFTQFRDNNDSHLMPVLMVVSWLIGIGAGYFLAKISLHLNPGSSEEVNGRD